MLLLLLFSSLRCGFGFIDTEVTPFVGEWENPDKAQLPYLSAAWRRPARRENRGWSIFSDFHPSIEDQRGAKIARWAF